MAQMIAPIPLVSRIGAKHFRIENIISEKASEQLTWGTIQTDGSAIYSRVLDVVLGSELS